MESWKIGPMVVNAILTKCITRTIDLAEQLALPPPINFPVVSHKKKQNLEYIGWVERPKNIYTQTTQIINNNQKKHDAIYRIKNVNWIG